MGLSKKAEGKQAELAAEAASIESSVRLAERMAREAGIEGWPSIKAHAKHGPADAGPGKCATSTAEDMDDLAAEAASIESSVKLAEQVARETGIRAEDWPVKKTLFKARATVGAAPPENVPVQSEDDLLAEAASIEASVRLAEQVTLDAGIDAGAWPVKKTLSDVPHAKEGIAWHRLTGCTGKELRREAKYQMYYVYEHYPGEIKDLAVQVIAKGCAELDEKGAKNFVNKVWANKRLQENLQGAMNATYYRELFEAEEQRLLKRSIPEIYLDGDNPQIIFGRMRTFLFKNMDSPNRIYLVRSGKGHNRSLPRQLFELFEAEKAKAARRMKNRQHFYR